jgi:hypothetical protein
MATTDRKLEKQKGVLPKISETETGRTPKIF